MLSSRNNNQSQWKRSQNTLQPSSSNIDTLSFPNTNINISESITGYTPTRLYNFNTGSLQDSLAQGQDMTISTDVTPTSHQLDFSGDDIECQVPSITPTSSEYSVQVRLSLTTMTGSPSVIMALTDSTNPGGVNSIQIRRSFNSIQVRFNSQTSGDTSFQTIADVTDIENQGYINFWITRYNTTFTVDVSNIAILTHTMEHPTDSLRLLLLEDQYITDPDIWTGNLERVVVFPRALSETERRNVESVGTIPVISDYQVKHNFTLNRPLNMMGNRILNVSQPSTAGDVATKTYVDNAIGGQNSNTQLLDQNDNVIINTLSGQVVVDNKRIEGVALPQGSNHAVNRDYVDTNRYDEIVTSTSSASLKVSQQTNDFGGTETYNTLETGTENSGRFALSDGETVRLSFGKTGFSFNGNGNGGASNPDGYFYWDAADDTYNIRLKENETEFGKPIQGQFAKGRAFMGDRTNKEVITDMSSYVYEIGADFGIVNRSLDETATLYLGSSYYSNQLDPSGGEVGVKNALIFDDFNSWGRGHMCFCNNIEEGGESYGSNVGLDKTRIRIRGNTSVTDIYDTLNMQDNQIIECADPTSDQHVATKNYVDTQINNKVNTHEVWFRIRDIDYNNLQAGALIPKDNIRTNWENSNFNNTTYEFQMLSVGSNPIIIFEVDNSYQIDCVTGNIYSRDAETTESATVLFKELTDQKVSIQGYHIDISIEFSFAMRVNISEIPT